MRVRDSLDVKQFVQMMEQVLDSLVASAEELNRLDAAVGDGDLGITMTLGSKAVRGGLPTLEGQDIGTILTKSGMAFNTAAPSTMGALMAIGAMRAGKEAKGTPRLDLPLLAKMARAAKQGIMEKGGAQRGDKTLLDALGPAADSLEASSGAGKTLKDAVADSLAAARAGVEATIPLKAKSGRAAWITERTAGQPDPGATVIVRIWEAMADFVG